MGIDFEWLNAQKTMQAFSETAVNSLVFANRTALHDDYKEGLNELRVTANSIELDKLYEAKSFLDLLIEVHAKGG